MAQNDDVSRDGQERFNLYPFRNAFLILWNAQERVPEIFFRNGSHCNAFLTPKKWPRSRSFRIAPFPAWNGAIPAWNGAIPAWNGAILALERAILLFFLKNPRNGNGNGNEERVTVPEKFAF